MEKGLADDSIQREGEIVVCCYSVHRLVWKNAKYIDRNSWSSPRKSFEYNTIREVLRTRELYLHRDRHVATVVGSVHVCPLEDRRWCWPKTAGGAWSDIPWARISFYRSSCIPVTEVLRID